MERLCTLYSGSSGNAAYVGTEKAGILIDVGKNAKQTTLALQKLSLTPEAVKAVFITHEHTDHIAGLRVFCGRHHIPVYASAGTLDALDGKGHLDGDFPVFQMDSYADIADLHIQCFHTSHDCAEGYGYTVTLPSGKRISVATDTGVVTNEVKSAVLGCNAVVLESNHDINMLMCGPYPYPLKERILSERGHLSNDAAATLACDLLHSGTTQFILGHLSTENNVPELAYQTSVASLSLEGATVSKDYHLAVAPRHDVLEYRL